MTEKRDHFCGGLKINHFDHENVGRYVVFKIVLRENPPSGPFFQSYTPIVSFLALRMFFKIISSQTKKKRDGRVTRKKNKKASVTVEYTRIDVRWAFFLVQFSKF